jgi:ribosomal protein L16 Arg81 hydroxylase
METLEFNAIKTVGTINKDSILQKVYEKKFGKKYNSPELSQASKANQLADETIDFLREVFQNVILNKEDLLDTYQKIVEEKTPRRYGKTQIQKDIQKQDGLVIPLQRTMLNLTRLYAMQSNLAQKGVSDRYKGTQKLSKTDLKTINAAIRDFEIQIQPILKRKK